MIGVDWGTSNLRAYRLGADGAVLDRVESEQGILEVPRYGFPDALRAVVAPWLAAGETRILLCGMVGSRQGWIEAPYLDCPAAPEAIARATVPVPFDGAEARIVPGLTARDAAGVPDVMRGEETKLVALIETVGAGNATVCLPGTHTKWVRLKDGAAEHFATHMTGELRAVLLDHSILGRLARGAAPDEAAYRRGLARAREPGGLAHHLFGTRALGLAGDLAPEAVAEYLSGVLIGHEIIAVAPTGPVELAGSAALTRAYRLALEASGVTVRVHSADLVARGLHALGVHWP